MNRSMFAMREHASGGEDRDVANRALPNTIGPALLSVRDAARVLGVTVSWVYEHLRPTAHDRLPHVKLGKYVRIHPDDLAAYIDAKRRAHAGQRSR